MIKYGQNVEVELSLTSTYKKALIKDKLRNLQRPGNFLATNTSHALARALKEFKTNGRCQTQFDWKIILITDGRSTDTRYLWDTVDQLIKAKILCYCVGVGDEILGGKQYERAQSELRGIAGKERYVVFYPSFDELNQFAERLSSEVQRCGGMDDYYSHSFF